jgi:hypothetical protein
VAREWIVAPGHVVAGKGEGSTITKNDIDRIDILVESGRLIPVPAKSSGNMKAVNTDVLKEDD